MSGDTRFTPYALDLVAVDEEGQDLIVMGASRCMSGSSSSIVDRKSSLWGGGVGSLTTTSVSILCCMHAILNWSDDPVGALYARAQSMCLRGFIHHTRMHHLAAAARINRFENQDGVCIKKGERGC